VLRSADLEFLAFVAHSIKNKDVVCFFDTAKVHHYEGVLFGFPYFEEGVSGAGEEV